MWNNIKNGASQMIKTGFGGFVHRAFTGTATGATFNAGGMAESAAAAAAGIATTAFGGGAVGAAMGAGGEIAGQGYLISQGYQNSFDWKQFGKTTCGAVIAGTAMGAAFGAAGQTKAGSRFFQWLETPTQFEQNAAKGIKQFWGDNRGSVSIEALLGKGGTTHTQNLDGLNVIRNHLTNDVDGLDFEPNQVMMNKIEEMLFNNQKLTGAYKDFYEHELTESMLMKQGYGYNDAHNMALEVHNVQPQALYSPEVVQEYPKWFNKNDFDYWGISPKQ